MWLFHFNSGGCNGCDIEFVAALTPLYDVERMGIQLVSSPRHADILVVTGPVTLQSLSSLKLIYEQMPSPKYVIAVGNCACDGCVFKDSYNVLEGVDKVLPVDVYIPGCPPSPRAIFRVLQSIYHGKLVVTGEKVGEEEVG